MKKKSFNKTITLEYYEDQSIPEKRSYKWWPISPDSFDNLLIQSYYDENNYQI